MKIMNFNCGHEDADDDSNAECSLNTRRGKDQPYEAWR